ncbi:MAG: hypothetical protein ACE5EG_00680 [Thermoanaerobaculia bacterium]
MSRLLGLAILVLLIYFALTQGLPWLKTAMGSGGGGSAGDGPSADCVASAAAASDTVADEVIPNARPPVDAGVWGTVLVRAAGSLAAAENACACPTTACATATEAIYELRSLYDELDDMARGNPAGFGNPARRMERVYDLLNRARAQAASE